MRPEMPAGGVPWRPFALEKLGGEEGMRRAFAHVTEAGRPDGVRFDFDLVASAPNTVDAHRLILHVAGRGKEWPMADALFRGYFAEGRDLNDAEALTRMPPTPASIRTTPAPFLPATPVHKMSGRASRWRPGSASAASPSTS
jgi:hypothetical protein